MLTSLLSRRTIRVFGFLFSTALFLVVGNRASAVVSITTVGGPVNLSTQPGSSTDFTLFGMEVSGLTSYGGTRAQPTVLTDFTFAPGAGAHYTYGGNTSYSNINAPSGSGSTNVNTGIIFGSTTSDLVDFTLGTANSTFDFSNFNVYLMYGNAHDGYETNSTLTATLLPSASAGDQTALATLTAPALDSNSAANGDYSVATFQEFNITGASAGDILRIGTSGLSDARPFTYLGGVSFEAGAAVPEPKTYLLLACALGLAGFLHRRFKAV